MQPFRPIQQGQVYSHFSTPFEDSGRATQDLSLRTGRANLLRLRRHLDNYRSTLVVDFDEQAAEHYRRLKATGVRIGTMDLKIAAIALSLNATLLSRNLVDFEKVPGLRGEDWTR